MAPLVTSPSEKSVATNGVEGSSYFFPFRNRRVIPDGVLRWSNFRVGAEVFGRGTTLTKAKLSMTIKTPHRGDLFVMLSSPDGTNVLLHEEEGTNNKDLIYNSRDVTKNFAGIDPYGSWVLRVQDRPKGDRCVLKSFRLELQVEEQEDEGNDGGNVPTPLD